MSRMKTTGFVVLALVLTCAQAQINFKGHEGDEFNNSAPSNIPSLVATMMASLTAFVLSN